MKIPNLYKYLGRKRWLLILYLIVNPINSILEILLAYATAAAIEYAINGAIDEIFSYVVAFLIYVIIWFLFCNFHTIIRNKLIENAIVSLKADLVERLLFTSSHDFNKQNTGTYLAYLTSDIEIIRNSYFFELLSIYGQVVQFVVALVAMMFVSEILGVFVVGMALIQVLIPITEKKRISRLGTEYAKQQQAYTKGCKEMLSAFLTVNLFGVQKNISDLHTRMAKKAENARSHSKIMNSVVSELSFSAGNIMYLGIFLIGAVLALKGYLTIGAIIAASQLMVYIATPLTTLSSNMTELQASFEVADNLQEILQLPPQNMRGIQKDRFNSVLKLEQVSFCYDQKVVLHDISCVFEKGKKYLLMGPSGSGKSTLLALLTRQYAIQGGKIEIDGRSLSDLSMESFHRLILLNPQEPYLFDWSIAENIRLFQPISENVILELLNKVGLKEKIESLPNGIDSDFGENGCEFSGGEKQRIGVVRAVLRNPQILLMDECTSHLDVTSAKQVENLLLGLPETTVIIVSHHPSQELQNAVDEVYILNNGKLEKGRIYR